MHASQDTKKKILHRLNIVRGHLDKVISMVVDDTYCIDVLHQSHAIQSALKEIDSVLLESHLKNCVVPKIKDGQPDTVVEEVMKIFSRQGGRK